MFAARARDRDFRFMRIFGSVSKPFSASWHFSLCFNSKNRRGWVSTHPNRSTNWFSIPKFGRKEDLYGDDSKFVLKNVFKMSRKFNQFSRGAL